MKKKELIITVSGQVVSGKSRVLYLMKNFLKSKGFNVSFDGSLDFLNETDFDKFMGENIEDVIDGISKSTNIIIKEEQLTHFSNTSKKAENEINQLFNDGLRFNYDFVYYNNINKLMFAIEDDGYSIRDIISKLKDGEKITFMLNNGQTWNGLMGNKFKMIYNKKYDGSIYWEHKNYGNCVRVDSDMGSLQEWWKELDKINQTINKLDIKFYWNGSIAGTNHSMIINDNEIFLGGVVSTEEEAKKDAIRILKEEYNIDYSGDDIKFVFGGRL